jgi:hypothetical protein
VSLSLTGQPSDTEIAISWLPSSAAPPVTYLVQYADATGTWVTVSRELRATSARIVGLNPGTAYNVRVYTINAAGVGAASMITATTAAAVTLPAGAPPAVTGLKTQSDSTGTSIPLCWDNPNILDARYAVDQRPHDGGAEWTSIARDVKETIYTASRLTPNTAYDFRVRIDQPQAGPWSAVATVTSGVRIPKWSDLVTDTDKPAEIDVTRVQMLFFTMISAVFVTLNILRDGVIPVIDPTYVALMGISNGLYVTAKFVRT